MRTLWIISLLGTLLFSCSPNFRQVASVENSSTKIAILKSTDIPTYGLANVRAHFIRNKNDHIKAEIFIILQSVKRSLIETINLVGLTPALPVDDFLRIFNELKSYRDYEVLLKLKEEALQLKVEAKDYYSLELHRFNSSQELQELQMMHEKRKSIAQKKFDIDMIIIGYDSEIKRNDLLKDVIEDSKDYHERQLRTLKTEKSKIEALFKSYLHRNNLYTDQIKDAQEYQKQVQITIDELSSRITQATLNEMIQSVAACTVPADLQDDLSDCQKAKRVLNEIISKFHDNIRMCEAELKNAALHGDLEFTKDTEVPESMIKDVEKSLTNATVVALNAKINELKRQITKFEAKLKAVEVAEAKARAANEEMRKTINTLIAETKNAIEDEIFKRDVEVKNMISHALTSIEANKDKEDMFVNLLNELDQVIANVESAIEDQQEKLREFNQEITVLKKQKNLEKAKKRRI